MATLSDDYRQFLATLSQEEREKYWDNHAEDYETKKVCEKAGEQWDQETESAALRYLKNLKKRRNLAGNQVLEETRSCQALEEKQYDPNSNFQELDTSSAKTIEKFEYDFEGRDSDIQRSDASSGDESDSDNIHGISDSDTEESDCESYADCLSVTSSKRQSGITEATASSAVVIKKIPKSAFREISKINGRGLFSQVSLGYIQGSPVKVKRFHAPMTGLDQNCWKIDAIKGIFQLDHRNLIPMLGMIDVALNECPQLVYASKDGEVTLLQYLRDSDKSNPKGYATFGKLSLDIINACEYLHKNGIVHGFLSANSVMIQKAIRSYGNKERKVHLNSLLSDYGLIQLTCGSEKNGFYKATNGKIVSLRWTPKEILTKPSEGATSSMYSFKSDVWSFGIVLWEMWTEGEVPYGKNKSPFTVEKDILNDCHPLTFKKPETCPRHILDVMESIFTPQEERPSFLQLKEKFDGFRKYKYEKQETKPKSDACFKPKSDECFKPKSDACFKPKSDACFKPKLSGDEKRPSSSSVAVVSPAYERYPRVRQWQNLSTTGNGNSPQYPGRKGENSSNACFKASKKTQPRTYFNSTYNKHHENSKQGKVAVVCVPMLPMPSGVSGNNNGMGLMSAGINQFQHQINLAQALTALSVAAAQQNPGSNNVNVNIDSQRLPRQGIIARGRGNTTEGSQFPRNRYNRRPKKGKNGGDKGSVM